MKYCIGIRRKELLHATISTNLKCIMPRRKKKKKRPDTNERIRTHTDDSTDMI